MIQQSVFTPVIISVFYTRALTRKSPIVDDLFHPQLMLSPGRPKIGQLIDDAIADAVAGRRGAKSVEGLQGVLVGVCGPVSLADEVSKAVGKVDPASRDLVGGVDCYEEYVHISIAMARLIFSSAPEFLGGRS